MVELESKPDTQEAVSLEGRCRAFSLRLGQSLNWLSLEASLKGHRVLVTGT